MRNMRILSVQNTEPRSQQQSSEEKGHRVLLKLREEICDLLMKTEDPVEGIEKAAYLRPCSLSLAASEEMRQEAQYPWVMGVFVPRDRGLQGESVAARRTKPAATGW
jgi:hypothetical protein